MLWNLMAVTGVVFWLFAVAAVVAIVTALEFDYWEPAAVVTGVFLLVLFGFTDFHARYGHLLTLRNVLLGAAGYVGCGMIWTVVKWQFFLSERRERWDDAVAAYRRLRRLPADAPLKGDGAGLAQFLYEHKYNEFVSGYGADRRLTVRPLASAHKATIAAWGAWWPLSVLWSIFDDVLKNLGRWIYRQMIGIYAWQARAAFRDVEFDDQPAAENDR
jgi:hypothetical protein